MGELRIEGAPAETPAYVPKGGAGFRPAPERPPRDFPTDRAGSSKIQAYHRPPDYLATSGAGPDFADVGEVRGVWERCGPLVHDLKQLARFATPATSGLNPLRRKLLPLFGDVDQLLAEASELAHSLHAQLVALTEAEDTE